jgi:hypothetical protein
MVFFILLLHSLVLFSLCFLSVTFSVYVQYPVFVHPQSYPSFIVIDTAAHRGLLSEM